MLRDSTLITCRHVAARSGNREYVDLGPGAGDGEMAYAVLVRDPFVNGMHATMPLWYVRHQLAYVLGYGPAL